MKANFFSADFAWRSQESGAVIVYIGGCAYCPQVTSHIHSLLLPSFILLSKCGPLWLQ